MTDSMAAPEARGKKSHDVIFGAAIAARADIEENGRPAVVNATIGAILDEEERLVCLPTVEKVYRSLSMEQVIAYAPVAGMPAFLKAAEECCFGDFRPEGFTAAVSTAGGTGAIHHVIQNYTEPGDEVLTSDWYWSAYQTLCEDNGRRLRTYRMLDGNFRFNHADFEAGMRQMAARQDWIAAVINTPAHNPTGYGLGDEDWDRVLALLKELADAGKHVTLLADVSYIDYAGERAREFFRKFSGLSRRILVVAAFSLSKSFTLYGQRIGAMIGISSSRDVIREFREINTYTNRATWSNNCRSAQECLVTIWNDPALRSAWKQEQQSCYALIRERARIFTEEAGKAGLSMLPYQAGYFLSIPAKDPQKVCGILQRKHIHLVPLAAGIRLAVCAVPKAKMYGLAGKVKAAMEEAGEE